MEDRKSERQKDRKTERQIMGFKKTLDSLDGLKQLPTMLDTPLAGFLDESTPLVCGISI